MKERMLFARSKSPTNKKGCIKSPETRRRISETVKKRWTEGVYEGSKNTLLLKGHTNYRKREHDKEVAKLVERLTREGHALVFADLKGYERPDIITFHDSKVHIWDVKLNRETVYKRIE